MAKRQPDRFERLSSITVQRLMGAEALDLTAASCDMVRGAEHIVQQLLSRQHRAVVRVTRAMKRSMEGVNNAQGFLNGYSAACDDLLVALARRGR